MDSVITKSFFLKSPNPSIPVPISSVKPSSLKLPSVKSPSIKSPSVRSSNVRLASPELLSIKNTATDKANIISARLSSVKDSIENETSNLDYFGILRYIFIILIIIFLGYNLFAYLGGDHKFGLSGIFKMFSKDEDEDKEESDGNKVKLTRKQLNESGINQLNKNLNSNKKARNKGLKHSSANKEGSRLPVPDESDSNTQRGHVKPGFCYVGEDRGIRSCVKVNESDICMSGEIFPTQAICVNPSLRE